MTRYITIHPYIDITISQKGALLYNTLTSKCYEIKKKKNIELLRQLSDSKKNSWVVKLSQIEMQENIEFISFLKENFLGSYFQPEQNSTKNPIQVFPQLKIRTEIELYDNVYEFSIGEKILLYLDELTIYLTNTSGSHSHFVNGYKQFIYPIDNKDSPLIELNLPQVKNIINQIENSNLSNINFLGGNIFKYSHYSMLLGILQYVHFNISFHFLLEDLITADISTIQNLKILNPNIIVHIVSSDNNISIKRIIALLTSFSFDFSLNMIVQNDADIACANNINDCDLRLTPYFTGSNYDFFSKYVFLTKEDIHSVMLSQIEILANSKINSNNFGKIQILNNGDVYANINHPKLGSINKKNIKEAIVKELRNGYSWLNLRNKVSPCKHCIYNKICPPISNYEYIIKKNNLCNIKV